MANFFKNRTILTALAVATMFLLGFVASLQPPARHHKGKLYTDRVVSTYPAFNPDK